MTLTNKIINTIMPKDRPYKVADGAGLYLFVQPNNSKYWRYKYRYQGKEKVLALGVYPDVSLKEARQRLSDARKQLANNIDPGFQKKEIKQEITNKHEDTFQHIALDWHKKNSPSWKEKYGNTVLKRIESDLFPRLGNMPIREINPLALLEALRIIESRSIDTAHRVLQICSHIFKYAIAIGKAEYDITSGLTRALSAPKREHYSSLSEKELIEFIASLDGYKDRQTRLALKFLILTFVRSNELRAAKWEEIDWIKREWRIPAERMKMKDTHIVPLSIQAINILRELQGISGNREYILPGARNSESYISENIMLHALYDLGYKGKTTVHGFRATASTILNENGFPSDIIERQLSHAERNKVRAAYNHAQYLPERKKMMQWWGDHLDQQGNNNIIYAKFG